MHIALVQGSYFNVYTPAEVCQMHEPDTAAAILAGIHATIKAVPLAEIAAKYEAAAGNFRKGAGRNALADIAADLRRRYP